jgi:hypothetical protein
MALPVETRINLNDQKPTILALMLISGLVVLSYVQQAQIDALQLELREIKTDLSIVTAQNQMVVGYIVDE